MANGSFDDDGMGDPAQVTGSLGGGSLFRMAETISKDGCTTPDGQSSSMGIPRFKCCAPPTARAAQSDACKTGCHHTRGRIG